jgi:hypothetical protein
MSKIFWILDVLPLMYVAVVAVWMYHTHEYFLSGMMVFLALVEARSLYIGELYR